MFEFFSRKFWGGDTAGIVSPKKVKYTIGELFFKGETYQQKKMIEWTNKKADDVNDLDMTWHGLFMRRPMTHIIIHHSLTKDGASVNWEAIRRYHTSYRYQGQIIPKEVAEDLMDENIKGVNVPWSDIGYHFGIEKIGEDYHVMKGRAFGKRGAHTKEGNYNRCSCGICVIGNFDNESPTEKAWVLALLLVNRILKHTKGNLEDVIGHREAQLRENVPEDRAKTCPGLMFSMDKFRSSLEYVSI